jgi:hypothetical protein
MDVAYGQGYNHKQDGNHGYDRHENYQPPQPLNTTTTKNKKPHMVWIEIMTKLRLTRDGQRATVLGFFFFTLLCVWGMGMVPFG